MMRTEIQTKSHYWGLMHDCVSTHKYLYCFSNNILCLFSLSQKLCLLDQYETQYISTLCIIQSRVNWSPFPDWCPLLWDSWNPHCSSPLSPKKPLSTNSSEVSCTLFWNLCEVPAYLPCGNQSFWRMEKDCRSHKANSSQRQPQHCAHKGQTAT